MRPLGPSDTWTSSIKLRISANGRSGPPRTSAGGTTDPEVRPDGCVALETARVQPHSVTSKRTEPASRLQLIAGSSPPPSQWMRAWVQASVTATRQSKAVDGGTPALERSARIDLRSPDRLALSATDLVCTASFST